jgi:hypothetical protein
MRRIQGENLRKKYGGHYMPLYAVFWPRPENTRIMRMRLCTVFCMCTLANILTYEQFIPCLSDRLAASCYADRVRVPRLAV